jgi:DNA polymerase nu
MLFYSWFNEKHPIYTSRAIKSGGDIFVELAAVWLEKDVSLVSRDDRERTKHVVYALMYGAGKMRLAEILAITPDQGHFNLAEKSMSK